jgi:magnesium transporter
MEMNLEHTIAMIEAAFESGNLSKLTDVVTGMRAADVAEIMIVFPPERREVLFHALDMAVASETLTLLEEGAARELLGKLDEMEIVPLVDLMASDDATDIIKLLPPEEAQRVLTKIKPEEYKDVLELLKFDEESAGGLMAREIMTVKSGIKIADVVRLLRKEAEDIGHIQNIYVVDHQGVLLGFIPVFSLLVLDPESPVDDVMTRDVVSVTVDTDQEEVAAVFAKYDLYSLPVTDQRGRLVGRITVDDIIDVIEEEANEDITLMAGTGDEEFWETSPVRVSRARLPWLLTGLFGGIASAFVMNHFRNSLESVLTLAFFVPVITAMGGNVGIQSSAIVVRELAVGSASLVRTGSKLMRELKVSLINGFVLGSVLLVITFVWQRDYRLGMLLGLCMLTIILWATLMGAIVPLLLKRMNIDPALATGPFITTSNDILGILIYLGIATVFLDWLGSG